MYINAHPKIIVNSAIDVKNKFPLGLAREGYECCLFTYQKEELKNIFNPSLHLYRHFNRLHHLHIMLYLLPR